MAGPRFLPDSPPMYTFNSDIIAEPVSAPDSYVSWRVMALFVSLSKDRDRQDAGAV